MLWNVKGAIRLGESWLEGPFNVFQYPLERRGRMVIIAHFGLYSLKGHEFKESKGVDRITERKVPFAMAASIQSFSRRSIGTLVDAAPAAVRAIPRTRRIPGSAGTRASVSVQSRAAATTAWPRRDPVPSLDRGRKACRRAILNSTRSDDVRF